MTLGFLLSCNLSLVLLGLVLKIYARLSYLVCMLNGIVICSGPDSKLMSSCVKTICDVGCHSGNDKYWSKGIMKYSYGDICCLYNVTWNGLCRNHGDCDCNICGDGTVTFICCVCPSPGDGGEKTILCGAWYGISVCDGVQVYLRVVSDADSPILYVHIHYIRSNIHLGNVMLYGLILDIGNSELLHGIWHSLLMMVLELLLVVVQLGVSQLHLWHLQESTVPFHRLERLVCEHFWVP